VPRSRSVLVAAVLALACAVLATGCGRRSGGDGGRAAGAPVSTGGDASGAAEDLGFPVFATKNTTRVAGADATADAAGVARAVFPGARPAAVALAPAGDWRAALVASVFMSAPLRAPLLLGGPKDLPGATTGALAALAPRGAAGAGGAQVLRVGDVARPDGLRTSDLRGRDAFALARAVDAAQATARGAMGDTVVVVSADDPAYAMPAAAWAAKSGDPILFTRRDALPADTRAALAAHGHPRIYVLGPPAVVSAGVVSALRGLGTVTRIAAAGDAAAGGRDPVANAIAFARFADANGHFGWGVVDPGHGLVIARASADPATAAAVAPLSASGTYGPLLLNGGAARLDPALGRYLLDIQPGYTSDPTRGVYNRAWVVGDPRAITPALQSQIDRLLEIVPVRADTKATP
jgi:hypothetical protein